MKKTFYFLIIFVLCFSACSPKPNITQNTPIPSQSVSTPNNTKETSVAISAIKAVLQNKKKFYCAVYKRNIYLKDFHSDDYLGLDDKGQYKYSNDYESDINHVYSQFCILDMDSDGYPEILLESKTTSDILLFHYENGKVYGNLFPYRGMELIKKDASFISSGGADDNVIGKIRFSKGKVLFNELCIIDGHNNIYRINGENASQEEVRKYAEKQFEKEDVKWHTYNNKNIEKYFVKK